MTVDKVRLPLPALRSSVGSSQLTLVSRRPQDVIVVGSSPKADLQVEDASVAAEHARLERRASRVYLLALLGDEEDLHSASGEAVQDTSL